MASEIEVLEDTTAEKSTAENASKESSSDLSLGDDVYTAAAFGDMEKLQRLVEAGHPVNEPDGKGYYALQWAALNNRVAAAQYILQHGALPNTMDRSGQTALHWSAVRGHVQVADLLVKNGADWDAGDLFGYKVMHVAAQYGQTKFIAYMVLRWRADLDALDDDGRSPLLWAAYKEHPDTVRLLLASGADRAQQDKGGRTPLHWAANEGNLESCKVLVQAGEKDDLMVKDKYGLTPFLLAADDTKRLEVQNFLSNAEAVHMGRYRRCGGDTKFSELSKLGLALFERGLYGNTFVRKLSKFGRGALVWCIATVLLTTYILYVIPQNMTAPFGLFAWSGFFLATAGLDMFCECKSKDPGYVKRCVTDAQIFIALKNFGRTCFNPDFSRLCIRCKWYKPVGSEHCSTCDRCVEKFHHHCPWVSNCIGKKNKGKFFMFITLEVLAMIITGSAAIIRIVRDAPSRASFDASPSYSAAHNYGAILFFIMDISLFIGVATKIKVPVLQIARNMATYHLSGGFRNPFNHEVRRNISNIFLNDHTSHNHGQTQCLCCACAAARACHEKNSSD